jgi:hypothetical protein
MGQKTTALRLYKALRDSGVGRVRAYSGRGMYGVYCVGISLERGDETSLNVGFAGRPCIDSLGLGVIAYWPSCEWDDSTMTEKESA